MKFSHIILRWYGVNKRNLPWRNTNEPYLVWLSEIMLQQTRVAQGIPYYLKFVEAFPKVQDLAAASEEKVLKLWQGLGYYSRARNLHTTAKIITDKYKGRFPDTYEELLSLKGVGDYTASAIASICYNKPEAVVDGNVYRVLARYYGVDLPINSASGIHYFKALALKVMDVNSIGDYNQAIMEFGALQCTPNRPDCTVCPLQDTCVAYATKNIDNLPVKIKKTKVQQRYFNYLVVVDKKKHTLLHQRKGSGIWQNLYEFPLLESKKYINKEEVANHLKQYTGIEKASEIYLFNESNIVHKLSHQHLHTRFWIIIVNDKLENGIEITALYKFPVPVLIADFIKTFKI